MNFKRLAYAFLASFLIGFSAHAAPSCEGEMIGYDTYVFPSRIECVSQMAAAIEQGGLPIWDERVTNIRIELDIHPEEAENVLSTLSNAKNPAKLKIKQSHRTDKETGLYYAIFETSK